jgi:chemotaxis protein MotB
MPQGPDGNTIIIIKKVSGHGGAHGGAWKVAYADFVTSMMALFMVLWLISASSESEREQIAEYFRQPGLFSLGGGRSPIEMKEQGLLEKKQVEDQLNIKRDENAEESFIEEHMLVPTKRADSITQEEQTRVFEETAQRINERIAGSKVDRDGVLGNIEVKIDAHGMHIDIMDSKKSSMFEIGRDVLLPEAKTAMLVVADLIKDLPNPIDIEGHTDSTKFIKSISHRYDNWYLASDRANIARKVFLQAGINPERIRRIVGYADTQPKDAANLNSPSNRRITVTVSYNTQEQIQELENLTGKSISKMKESMNHNKTVAPTKNNIMFQVEESVTTHVNEHTYIDYLTGAIAVDDFK